MPEFLQRRYGHSVRLVMAVFWLALYIFVNLTAILWLGATAVHTVTGIDIEYALGRARCLRRRLCASMAD